MFLLDSVRMADFRRSGLLLGVLGKKSCLSERIEHLLTPNHEGGSQYVGYAIVLVAVIAANHITITFKRVFSNPLE